MISKLKEVCGYEYTNRLQRMFIGAQREQGSTPVIDASDCSFQIWV